jgi:hypothetical protein
MKTNPVLLVFALVTSLSSVSGSVSNDRRDKALKGIDACLRRNEVSSRECSNLNQNVATLVDVYNAGDKSVLPPLFHFTYLTDFYDDALLADPDSFLNAMGRLPEADQQAVAIGIAGGKFRPLKKPRFEAIRDVLTATPDTSPRSNIAKLCLREVQSNNASLFLDYFPAGTFTGPAANFTVYWFSRDLYTIGEMPLPSAAQTNEIIYRFTYLGAFSGPRGVTLTVMPDGTGRIVMKSANEARNEVTTVSSLSVSQAQVSRFVDKLQHADFWHLPPEVPSSGLDGAEWILEGVQGGEYHVAVRWCPGVEGRSAHELDFADASRVLFELAGHKHGPGC